MANGTIAFDTLTTSDSVNTGTEKSIDTSYIYNGSSKSWLNYAQNGDTIKDSFNISSVSDETTSEFKPVMTNVMQNINYSVHGAMAPNYGVATGYGMSMYQDGSSERAPTTADYFVRTVGSNGSGYDSKYNLLSLHGDVA
jgi:hypothetical protein